VEESRVDTPQEEPVETTSQKGRSGRVKWTTQEWVTSLFSVTALVISGIAGWYSYQSFYYQYKRIHHEVLATATGLDFGTHDGRLPSVTTYTLKNVGNQNEVISLVFLGFSRHLGDKSLSVPLMASVADSEAVGRYPIILQPGDVEYGKIKHPTGMSRAIPYHSGEPLRSDSLYVWLGVDAIGPNGGNVRTYLYHALVIHPDSSVVEGSGWFRPTAANVLEGPSIPEVNYVLPGGERLPLPRKDSSH